MADINYGDRQRPRLGSDNEEYAPGDDGGAVSREEVLQPSDDAPNDRPDNTTIGRNSYGSSGDNAVQDQDRSYGTSDREDNTPFEPSSTFRGNSDQQSSLNDYGDISDSSLGANNLRTSSEDYGRDKPAGLGTSDDQSSSDYTTEKLSSYGAEGSTEGSLTNNQDREESISGQEATNPSSDDTADSEIMAEHAPETRLGISDTTEPYRGGHDSYGSGTTGGPGHGNKTASDPEDLDTSSTRLDHAHKTDAYLGGGRYGSGTTAGPGAGNKTSDSVGSNDSTMGKLMEKAGGLLKKDGLVEKGQEKREAAGYGTSES